MRYRVRIEYHTPALQRWRSLAGLAAHWAGTLVLVALGTVFLVRETLPLARDWLALRREARNARQRIAELSEERSRLNLSGPFAQRWHPYLYIEFSRLCTSRLQVFQRLSALQQMLDVDILNLNAEEKKGDPGYDVKMEVFGTFEALLEFLNGMEQKFRFLKVNRFEMKPEFSDKKYEGKLHASFDGWVW